MVGQANKLNRGAGRWYARRATLEALAALILIAALGILAPSLASASSEPLRLIYAPGKIVPIPASIPHEEGDMVDRRIIPDLRWIASRFPIYITDGYSGALPDGKLVGCDRCHTRNSDHYNGLAVDIVPASGTSGRCEGQWNAITRLAHWAEPVQNHPIAPFRWVGYDGDAGHGCGNHLHLSWNHAPAAAYSLADWVEVFSSGTSGMAPKLPAPTAPAPGRKSPPGPSGGISKFQPGGVSARD
jgi:hypothetical protein